MEQKNLQVYYGSGQGKTTAAIGQCIRAISKEQQVVVIQYLKGKEQDDLRCLDQFDSNIKVFRFEKINKEFRDLSPQEQEEEKKNLLNGVHYARKVAETGECDLLVLDEILGMVDLQIVSIQDLLDLIMACGESCHMVMTGQRLPQEILEVAETVTRLESIK